MRCWSGAAKRDLELAEVGPPGVIHQLQAVALGEVAQVGDKGRDEQHIPAQCVFLLPEAAHRFSPAHVL